MSTEQAKEIIDAVKGVAISIDSVEWSAVVLPVMISSLVTLLLLVLTIWANKKNTLLQIEEHNK